MKGIVKLLFLCCTTAILMLCSSCEESLPPISDTFSEQIRLNQIGYYPAAIKKAVIVDGPETQKFMVVDSVAMNVLLTGTLSSAEDWKLAGETVRIADFTKLTTPGTYLLLVPDLGYSYPFKIKKNVLHEAFLGSIKGLYYQRVGIPLKKEHAGKWHRDIAHLDDSIPFHPSTGKTSGYISSPGGWYDAGDYNKYIVNAAFPLGQFYLLQEQYPELVSDNMLNIPESGNGRSDYLDELKYEMDWALTMQDGDGGLFHKLTTKNFEGMVMPSAATSQRYIVGKGTTATLDFAACAAQAYRVFKTVDSAYAEKCLTAAKKAYDWAMENPAVAFTNPEDVHTGQYGDADFEDEWFWANAELLVATQDSVYRNNIKKKAIDFNFKAGESWTAYMRFLGMFTLLDNKEAISEPFYNSIKNGIIASADRLVTSAQELDYFQPIDDFHWGSNSDVLNAAMVMAQAYRLKGSPKYLIGVQQAMDYILGNNAMGVSYLTGFGDKTPMFIHHRQSAADGLEDPVPGLLSGGPNSRLQDVAGGAVYPENPVPMQSWVDQEPSYASNEICLNWNAPMTYVLGFLEHESD
ncbi:glycoside hydrolase family 9 protein [Maribacter sp. 2-571]|uniref:glycoside hydrolase family 9 protein n=1 Tax=Maribacter sp. 2-571 TaxID=3417569 RepID=UPI003D34D629